MEKFIKVDAETIRKLLGEKKFAELMSESKGEGNVKLSARKIKDIELVLKKTGLCCLRRVKSNPKRIEIVGNQYVTIAPRYRYEKNNDGGAQDKANAANKRNESEAMGEEIFGN